MMPRSPAPSMRPPAIALLSVSSVHRDAAYWRLPRPDLAQGARHDAGAGYREGSDTRLRAYGHGAAGTVMPPASLPPASPEPPGGTGCRTSQDRRQVAGSGALLDRQGGVFQARTARMRRRVSSVPRARATWARSGLRVAPVSRMRMTWEASRMDPL